MVNVFRRPGKGEKENVIVAEARDDLNADYVRSILDYDANTGVFRWRRREDVADSWNAKFAGKIAGNVNIGGYLRIGINNRHCYGHRLAWLVCNGEWPSTGIDHIDGNTLNNRISNLRLATYSENGQNRLAQRNSSSGYKGVYWHSRRKVWESKIQLGKKQSHLGYFHDIENAKRAYQEAEEMYFGEFRRMR